MLNELKLPKRVHPQPIPHLNIEGDCGPCVVAGITGRTPKEIYELINVSPKSLDYFDMVTIVRACLANGWLQSVIEDVPSWPLSSAIAFYGPAIHYTAWWRYLRMAMEANYYGIAFVNYQERGPHYTPDHCVLICGTRYIKEDHRSRYEILISCSSTTTFEDEWAEVSTFIRTRGGYNLILARPNMLAGL